MATSYIYSCNKCGYSVQASGGHDYGMFAVTDTYICKSCKEIVDVAVGYYGETFSKDEISIKILQKEFDWDIDFYCCPLCGSKKELVKWNISRRPCPNCDGKMGKDIEGGTILWD